MARAIEFNFRSTAIGSMPQADAQEACRLVRRFLDIPVWPQLPHRSYLENMYAQYSQGFPGLRIENDHIIIDQSGNFVAELEKLYADHADGNLEGHGIGREYSAGLYALVAQGGKHLALKGQIAGPISWGLSIADVNDVPIIYDDVLGDALVKHLALKAAWQERFLKQYTDIPITFFDEPYLSSLGTAFVSLSPEQVRVALEGVMASIHGLKGVHCCGGADWSLLLETPLDILSFDAYTYASSLALYPDRVKALLKRGGAIAWGIVPTTEEVLVKESVASLKDRLEEGMAPFARNGMPFADLVAHGLVTPSCGLASLTPGAAELALELVAGVSAAFHKRYG